MSRAAGPRPSLAPGGTGACWAVLATCWGLIAVNGIIWAAARTAATLTGGTTEPFGTRFAADLLHGHTSHAWPHTPTPLVAATTAVLLTLAATLATAAGRAVARRWPAPTDPIAALARNPALTALTGHAAARTAIHLRPSLHATSPRRLHPTDTGLALGQLLRPGHRRGPTIYAGWEDTIVAVMAPRTGKTTAQAIPFTLSAPGAVIATSNKADLWAATAALRAPRGPVWLFDPQNITHQPQTWWWNPLHRLHTVEHAHRLAAHFVLTVADQNRRDLWGPAAQDLLAALFLAAATTRHTLHHVAGWLTEPAVPTPAELLATAGFTAMAASLRGAQNGAIETRDGIYQTARTAATALTDPAIMAWVTPPRPGHPMPMLDPGRFAASTATLYLLSKSRSAAAPLIAALTDTAIRAAEHHAETLGGRLDPPLVAPLDEAANICRIADLPDLYSHLGSRGIIPITILQSYEQGITVWGEPGMAALWGAATKKIIGAGADSPRLARDLATLTGQHDIPIRTISYGDGRASEQISLRRQDILEPAAIRALPPGTALLLATGIKPALIHLTPWHQGPRAAEITAAQQAAQHAIRAHANHPTPAAPHHTAPAAAALLERPR